MGRLLRSRLGVGSSVGIRRGEEEEEGEDGVVALPASWGMPLGRGLLGTGGGGIIISEGDGDGDDAGAGAGGVMMNEGGAGRSATVCCCWSRVILARLGLMSRLGLGLVGRPATLGGEGILEGGVGILDCCRSSDTLVGVDIFLGRTRLGEVGCRISGILDGVVVVGVDMLLGRTELGVVGGSASVNDDDDGGGGGGWEDSERTKLGTVSAGEVAVALGVACSSC